VVIGRPISLEKGTLHRRLYCYPYRPTKRVSPTFFPIYRGSMSEKEGGGGAIRYLSHPRDAYRPALRRFYVDQGGF